MKHLLADELLLIRGKKSFLLVGRVNTSFALCIETFQEEYCQTISSGDLVVVSAPEGGPVEPAYMLIELVRTYHIPLLVLPKDHPGSRRIAYVVSVGNNIRTDCAIRRGTHPEQHLICSADELSGISLSGTGDGVDISPVMDTVSITRVNIGIKTGSH
jgi:hypothetical protein